MSGLRKVGAAEREGKRVRRFATEKVGEKAGREGGREGSLQEDMAERERSKSLRESEERRKQR
jgi:hypothetical protein